MIDKWALNGENFLWRVPYGGRSAPVVMGNHLYVQNPSGRGADEQERVMCLDPDSGKVIWEYKFNLFQSDAPAHRVGWASPAVDPETGNVYALSIAAQLVALSKDGKYLWDRSFGEEWGAFTTHGGRTMSPIIDGDLVIVSHAVSNWGAHGNRAHRFIAVNKRTGEIVWVSNPGGRPYDTAYAAPAIAKINGLKLLGRRRRLRAQAADRRESLGRGDRQTRHQHRCGGKRQHGNRVARRREPRLKRDGDGGGDRRSAEG
ncbi:MAG: hypothetical protein DMG59_04290 [Acidobacteria bacterium]|nr:MAG: hypothetical protein DMG59_04290 [Acidobacteriota bacterium]